MKTTVKQLQVVRVRADRTTALPKAKGKFYIFNLQEKPHHGNCIRKCFSTHVHYQVVRAQRKGYDNPKDRQEQPEPQ